MKLTKRQLKRIIKEEKAKILKEYYPGFGSEDRASEEQFDAISEKIESLVEEIESLPSSQTDLYIQLIRAISKNTDVAKLLQMA